MVNYFDPLNSASGLAGVLGASNDPLLQLPNISSGSDQFGLILVRLLIQTAQELERAAQGNSLSAEFGPAANTQGLLSSLADPFAAPLLSSTATEGRASAYAPEVFTRAYRNGEDWQFVPTYIPPATDAAGVASAPAAPAAQTNELYFAPPPVAATTPSNRVTGAAPVSRSAALAPVVPSPGAMELADFPRPVADNGRGMHWVPTVSSPPEVVDRFVREMAAMNVTWAVFLNDHANIEQNEYLVDQLTANGIEPVMRIYTSGLEPISGDLGKMVRSYVARGVNYFQLYNEPNHAIENNGQPPDVARYLDLWIPAAKIVAENGGLPGFGALSPGGAAGNPYPNLERMDDRLFLRAALQEIKRRGEVSVLDRAWIAAHNYMGERSLEDPDGLLRVRQYDEIARQILGRSLPIIGTEGGSYTIGSVSETRQTELVTDAMRYMRDQREPFNFAYTYWVIANSAGGGGDEAWEWQALFQRDGVSPVVEALKNLA